MQPSWRELRGRIGRAWSGSRSATVLVLCYCILDLTPSHRLASNNDRNINGCLLSEALQGSCELLTVHGTSGVGRL